MHSTVVSVTTPRTPSITSKMADSSTAPIMKPTSPDGAPSCPPSAVLRPFVAETDLKIVRYLVGASVMEPLV